MTAGTMFGIEPVRWILLVVAILATLIVAEAWLGHYRSGFPLRVQYAPLLSGSVLALTCVAAAIAPGAAWAQAGLRWTGWIAIVTGVVGVGYHHWYGIVEKAGGYRWLLHYLMYGAPPLAPLALSAAGALTVVAAHGLSASTVGAGTDASRLLLAVAAVALAGAIIQTGILHYRGAFNSPLMYAPFTLPPLAAVGAAWLAIAPDAGIVGIVRVLLWGTVLLGFVGLGMHLRGMDRQMAGLHVFRFNILQGPPPLAPAVYAGFAIVGLLALRPA